MTAQTAAHSVLSVSAQGAAHSREALTPPHASSSMHSPEEGRDGG